MPDNIVTITDYSIDQDGIQQYHYKVYHKDDDVRKKALYMGTILKDGTPVNCTCTAGSLGKLCYHSNLAKEITEIQIE